MDDLARKVKKANRDFYDIVGSSYESIDGRRSEELICYVDDQVRMISRNIKADSILDLGCGNGFISRVSNSYFKRRYALDISYGVMKDIDDKNLCRIAADSDLIPIKDAQINCVVTFAVLHHCYSYEKILSEIYRVLTAGGIYYSDHDMDSHFFKRFGLLLKMYRKINTISNHHVLGFDQALKRIHHCSEFHSDGIPSQTIKAKLKSIGFKDIKFDYHWFGLSPLTNKMFGKRSYNKGYAPLVRIIAVK
ncbi:MAG: class I SAM-dependent methyltransferase [Candidatus Jettenia sp.]|uniref:Methyltransferase type 11 domain-containing protein n=1 Tax=Candidatus Jettenia caeni TaxID=247490 RepID=I3IR65_9BACT|nr:class I SAM-dependent methyltransferase [Candidatus Jettenia sp. AMX1]MBC6928565.1 class I SAM-dependent methyltransferase [Candidatus Jettenia sp.]NUN23462.1 class I SAM-dependent methyltransferase [Candidatus Jettenia caeni]KAA0249186.1 MAG: class I SAM-dependent methyltransferase [Candidatus Jettenia sp. AMX1]MCE7879784.1 class I SAM-dependent methyltransferase [Candidatus Jettenia sp. AMX1]MCQ3926465.1 class I SAM-dependent methyltransferase [Candidatus Jettenia sp.]